MDNYSLDPNMLVSALANKDSDALGGGNGLLWIFLLILFWGGNGYGFGGNRGPEGNAAVEGQIEAALSKARAADLSDSTILEAISGNSKALSALSSALDLQSEAVRAGITSLSNGLCDLGYKLSQDTASVISQVSSGQAELSRQLADCCCNTQRAIDATRYDLATGFCGVNTNIDRTASHLERYVDHKIDVAQAENRAGFQGIRDFMVNEKVGALETQLQSANLALQNNAQTRALMDYIDSKCTAVAPIPTPAP